MSGSSGYTLGLDVSTQSVTAVLVCTESGHVERQVKVEYAACVEVAADGSAVFPVAAWLDGVDDVFAAAVAAGWDLARVVGVCVSAQQHATVLCRPGMAHALETLGSGKGLGSLTTRLRDVLGPELASPSAPMWMDTSTAAQIDGLRAALGSDARLADGDPDAYVLDVSGSAYALRFPAAQLAKAAANAPDVYEATAVVHLLSSFVTSLLRGAHTGWDLGDGAGSNMVDLRARDWDAALCSAVAPDVTDKLLPLESGGTQALGTVARYFVDRYGLGPAAVVSTGTGDNPASLVGCGAALLGRVVVSLGTSDTVFASTGQDCAGRAGAHVFGNPAGGWMRLVCIANGSLPRDDARARAGLSWAQASDLLQELDPDADPDALPPDLDPASAALAALCLSQVRNIKAHVDALFPDPASLLLTGGGSANDGLAQLFADVFAVPVERLASPASAAFGAALCALASVTSRPWELIQAGVTIRSVTHPRP